MNKSVLATGCGSVEIGLAISLLLLGLGASPGAAAKRQVRVPENMEEDSLPERRSEQIEALSGSRVFHEFRFVDRRDASGITFRNQIVDDIGPRYKAVHYDHGNGLAAADVDGDRLIDLYFMTQLGSNELWKNLGGGKFRDITDESGLAMVDRISVTASFADYDNDGDADLFVTTVRKGNALFENDGRGRFTEVTDAAGLTYSGHSSGALFFDYDNDGWLDLFLTNIGVYTSDEQGRGGYYVGLGDAFKGHLFPSRAEQSVLYRNRGDGSFEDVSKSALLVDRSWAGDAAAADLNLDGFLDLYVLDMQGSDHYYENVRGRFFLDKTSKIFPKTPQGTMGIKIFDWNNDGLLDILLTDMHSDMGENIGPEREKLKARAPEGAPQEILAKSIFGNAFYENQGDGFREISDAIGVENYWPWGVSVDDLNADGWQDVFIAASMNYPFRYGINSVLLNDLGEKFLDSEFALGVEPRAGPLVQPWFELDCSAEAAAVTSAELMAGWEVFRSGGSEAEPSAGEEQDPRHPHCKGQTGLVTVMAARGTRSSVLFDLDNDGDLDIVTNEFFGRPQVLVSDLTKRKKIQYLKIRLVGGQSNRDGLGARVTVESCGRRQLKVHDGKSGYLSQSSLPLYFGLGDCRRVEQVRVEWPSGASQTVAVPEIRRLLEIVEPSPAEGESPTG